MDGFSIPVDLIPFRGVASADKMIAWPPGRDVVLNVAGFEEAWASSLPVEVEDGFAVRVASVPGLTLPKLIAWADHGVQNNKDAADLYCLLTTYSDAGNVDRLYDRESALLEAVEFDLELAGAELLGRDVAHICPAPTLVGINQAVLRLRVPGKLTCRDHSFFQPLEYIPALNGDSEVDIAGGASGPETVNVDQDQIARRCARYKERTVES